LSGSDGAPLALRTLSLPAGACAERAKASAVVIAAWEGALAAEALAAPTLPMATPSGLGAMEPEPLTGPTSPAPSLRMRLSAAAGVSLAESAAPAVSIEGALGNPST